MKVVLAIGIGIAITIISFIVILVIMLPTGFLGAMIFIGAKSAGATWSPYNISLAVSAGLIVLAMLVFSLSMISVPATVFFPAYSIYFLAPRLPALAQVVLPVQPCPGP